MPTTNDINAANRQIRQTIIGPARATLVVAPFPGARAQAAYNFTQNIPTRYASVQLPPMQHSSQKRRAISWPLVLSPYTQRGSN